MKHSVVLLLFILTIVTGQAQDFKAPAKGNAAIYFIRTTAGVLSMADFYFFDNDKLIGTSNGEKYLRYECAPGEHLFWARSENRDFITADLMAGKVYLIDAVPVMGVIADGVSLKFVDMSDNVYRQRIKRFLPENRS